MIPAFLLALREGLEAALILGIVLSVVHRVGRREQETMVWLGAGTAALSSLAAGAGLYALGVSFEGRAEEIFEGLAMLLAAGVLTWMIFWMDRQGRSIQSELEKDVQRATAGGGRWAIFSLAFVAVFPGGDRAGTVPDRGHLQRHSRRSRDRGATGAGGCGASRLAALCQQRGWMSGPSSG